MQRTGSIRTGVMLASIVAGPVFIVSAYAASLYLTIPAPVVLDANKIIAFALVAVPATALGFIIALVPNFVGAALMTALAERAEFARPPLVWTIVGAGIGMALALVFKVYPTEPELAFGLTIASAISARLCRTSLDWDAAL